MSIVIGLETWSSHAAYSEALFLPDGPGSEKVNVRTSFIKLKFLSRKNK
jgi:hypothetical protein